LILVLRLKTASAPGGPEHHDRCGDRQPIVPFRNQSPHPGLLQRLFFWSTAMKPLILCAAILGLSFAPSAGEAKGCIKGAIVGGVAGHLAGHGKVGAVAGCVIGHHEANKRDAHKTDQKAPPSSQDNRI
jgi:hypothetical protein